MKSIENLILDYRVNNCEETFNEIYVYVTKAITGSKDGNLYLRTVAKSMGVDLHSVKALFDDTILNAINKFNPGADFLQYFKSGFRRNRAKLIRDRKPRSKEVYDESSDKGLSLFDSIPDIVNIEDIVTTKKKADQRKLIDFLVAGENERTTAIVQAFLTTEYKTPTAIGKYLGLDHKQVSRAIKKLAGKFDSKQFGEVSDYLVAL